VAELFSLAVALPADIALEDALHIARLAGRLGYAAVHVPPEAAAEPGFIEGLSEAARPALVVVDEAVLDEAAGEDGDRATGMGVVRANSPDQVAAARASMVGAGISRPLLVAIPVSIGRTMSEAAARAEREPRFAGGRHPSRTGIFGTFEHAQEEVLALAEAGADGLIVDLPLERDVADVLAQVKALVVGATPELRRRRHLSH
jgi:hypothetical protein